VDFIVYGTDGIWAVEVKNSKTFRLADLRGLRSFKEEYPESETLFLYRGDDRLISGGVLCMPCADFLKRLQPGRSLHEFFI
jgi:hypothetical protein